MVPLWGYFVVYAPVKYIDPSGHCGRGYEGNEDCWEKYKELKRICPECTAHRNAEGEDIPLGQLDEAQLDNLVQAFSGEYTEQVPPSGDNKLSGYGWRLDVSDGAGVVKDTNIDFIHLSSSGENAILIGESNQYGLYAEFGASTGPLFLFNTHSKDTLFEETRVLGASAGVELETNSARNPDDGTLATTLYVGLGQSIEVGVPAYYGHGTNTYDGEKALSTGWKLSSQVDGTVQGGSPLNPFSPF
jgi:hypothetical protein